jgi:outer membrane usher protein
VPIGTDATVSISGGFILGDGAPAALLSGELQPVDDPSRKAVPFFTNRKGRFRVESVRPGKWQLVLFGHEVEPFPVEIGSEVEGVVDAGTLKLKAASR